MIFKIIFNYILGFVNITVEGFYIERFINTCINNNIFLWAIKRRGEARLTCNININDFKKIKKVCKKTKCKVKINSKRGIPILLHRYRKRKLLAIMIIIVLLIIIALSRFIWNIEIIGTENINCEEVLQELNEQGLEAGKLKSKIDINKIISNIRLKRNDISWMAIDIKGTNAIIKIVESKEKPNIVNEDEYCNIVSRKKGIITKITADNGTAQKKVGDMVDEGEILIAGYMDGKYTDRRYVHALGKVIAKVWYTKTIEGGNTREIEEKTGNSKNLYSININNFTINLYKKFPNFENYDKINETKKIKLFSNFYIPIEIIKTTYEEKTISEINYGNEELKEILIDELEQQFEAENLDENNIINKVVNFYNNKNGNIELEMTYEVLEEIGTEEKINF